MAHKDYTWALLVRHLFQRRDLNYPHRGHIVRGESNIGLRFPAFQKEDMDTVIAEKFGHLKQMPDAAYQKIKQFFKKSNLLQRALNRWMTSPLWSC